jgi:hypothetical protein
METCEYCARAERYGLLAAEWRVQPQRGLIYKEYDINGVITKETPSPDFLPAAMRWIHPEKHPSGPHNHGITCKDRNG